MRKIINLLIFKIKLKSDNDVIFRNKGKGTTFVPKYKIIFLKFIILENLVKLVINTWYY